ncbi:MAG: PLP-dependent transferase [Candidatus Limnocylindria bacterium]
MVVHSTTKYLNGHADVVGGAVVTRNDEVQERLRARTPIALGAANA